MASFQEKIITADFLNENESAYFVFGDNLLRKGFGGAAKLRHHKNSIGFITKKYPDNDDESFFRPSEYEDIFSKELEKLTDLISQNPSKIFYISQLGAGLANRYNIWEKVIKESLINKIGNFENVIFCWAQDYK